MFRKNPSRANIDENDVHRVKEHAHRSTISVTWALIFQTSLHLSNTFVFRYWLFITGLNLSCCIIVYSPILLQIIIINVCNVMNYKVGSVFTDQPSATQWFDSNYFEYTNQITNTRIYYSQPKPQLHQVLLVGQVPLYSFPLYITYQPNRGKITNIRQRFSISYYIRLLHYIMQSYRALHIIFLRSNTKHSRKNNLPILETSELMYWLVHITRPS